MQDEEELTELEKVLDEAGISPAKVSSVASTLERDFEIESKEDLIILLSDEKGYESIASSIKRLNTVKLRNALLPSVPERPPEAAVSAPPQNKPSTPVWERLERHNQGPEPTKPDTTTKHAAQGNKKKMKSIPITSSKPKDTTPIVVPMSEVDRRFGRIYAAAGILLLRSTRASGPQAMFTVEYRRAKWHHTETTHLPGGQKEMNETVRDTAVREFWEETDKVIAQSVVHDALGNAACLYLPQGRYVLFVAKISATSPLNDIVKLFNQRRWHNLETSAIGWMPVTCLGHSFRGKPPSDFMKKIMSHLRVREIIKDPPQPVDAVKAPSTLLKKIFSRVDAILSNPERHLLPADFDQALKPIVVKVKGPIEQLDPASAQYKALAVHVSGHPVAGIRVVNVPARQAAYSNSSGTEKKPLFHGTPHTANATAISLGGFDLSIVTNGRALGNGVYTAENIATPMGYARGSGSILMLSGKLDGQTNSQGRVHVFPDPNKVLPTAIFDFSTVYDAESRELAELRRQAEREEAEYAHIVAEARVAKGQFIADWSAAYTRLKTQARELEARLSAVKSGPGGVPDSLVLEVQAAYAELAVLDNRIPICLHKDRILSAIRDSDVLFVEAATGSGKSVMLCQYAADNQDAIVPADALPSSYASRVCVLQPKRANAESIARYVARLRNTVLGGEVGLHMGGGVHVGSDDTRIDFMTHGYFCNAAQVRGFLGSYHTIIIDEAHERSVDVEFSLAIITRYLRQIAKARADDQSVPQHPLKVVIASATLPEAAAFMNSIIPRGHLSSHLKVGCLTVSNRPFPIFTMPRPLPLTADTAAGRGQIAQSAEGQFVLTSAIVSNLLVDHAVSIAIEVLQRSQSGDILVFLPRTRDIRSALFSAYKHGDVAAGSQRYNSSFAFTCRIRPKAKHGESGARHEKELKNGKKVEFLEFSGGHTSSERQYVQSHPTDTAGRPIQRVIFTTNVAETGLTFPDLRFVIDSGLENAVVYDHAADLHFHTVAKSSQASLEQRKGRAGRVAAGTYIPLFSEEDLATRPKERPSVAETGDLTNVILRQLVQPDLVLREPISDEVRGAVLRRMAVFGLLADPQPNTVGSFELTAAGQFVARYGGQFRTALFMFACNQVGVPLQLASAAAAIIQNNSAAEKLLRAFYDLVDISGRAAAAEKKGDKTYFEATATGPGSRFSRERSKTLLRYLDRGSDHITAVRLLLLYSEAVARDADVQVSARTAGQGKISQREHVVDLLGVGQEILDELLDLMNDNQAKCFKQRLLGTAEIIDAQVRTEDGEEGVPEEDAADGTGEEAKHGARFRPDQALPPFVPTPASSALLKRALIQSHADHVAVLLQPGKANEGLSCVPLPQLGDHTDLIAAFHASAPNGGEDTQADIHGRSITAQGSAPSDTVAVYSQMISIDRNARPRVSMLTLCDVNELANSVPDWAKTTVTRVLESHRVARTVGISKAKFHALVRDSHRLRRDLEAKFGVKIDLASNGGAATLTLYAPESYIADVTRLIQTHIGRELAEVEVKFRLVPGAGKNEGFRTARGKLVDPIEQIIADATNSQSGEHCVSVSTRDNHLMVKLSGVGIQASPMVTAFVNNMMEKWLAETGTPASRDSQAMEDANHYLPNLVMITSKQQPQTSNPMVQVAHAIIWGGFKIYGGFVRDHVIRNERANDIDTVAPKGMDARAASQQLCQIMAGLGYRQNGSPKFYNAVKMQFQRGGTVIDIDVTEDTLLGAYPFVDCDVGNFTVSSTGLGLKRVWAGENDCSVASAIAHCRAKQFVFFCQPNNFSRMHAKYFGRGWTCVNNFPASVLQQFKPQHDLYMPDKAFSRDYSIQPPGWQPTM
ncbi:Helicase conserved C-terminal domain [Carpediemonas membranifera]|uniref:Helicase conserved C-terminal domain n=1 Tax=Carpediemonas membranifera TaxID=201153 RepID=A0A8J6E2U5_9EUKA|nr:Helicase conserved C-terminal domain [Carpediemonas membranifera]|eukprot:KAG9392317.1 Helicase conserved C-terminal domain [Carpediemonas membranifera]